MALFSDAPAARVPFAIAAPLKAVICARRAPRLMYCSSLNEVNLPRILS